ncbi:MAG: NAD-dependent epimerase/dehydratase family protein [Candidatus Lokiarchaeota archaeon]|nr:NAD-dependent epimerase/dehydratase family protein [Candidatus Lokiarchaeota archaeon]
MKILVTGANGFIGSHLCKLLLEKGEEVFAMVRKTSDLTLMKDLNPGLDGIELVYGDTRYIDTLKDNFVGKDAIISLAGSIKGFNQADYDQHNVDGNINVCEAVIEVNPNIKRLILTSSAAAAGPSKTGEQLTEEEPYRILDGDQYGASKRRMEQEIKPYFNKIKTLCIVRPPVVLGPGDMPSLDLYKIPKKGRKLIVGKEPHYYSIAAVQDICSGIYQMVLNEQANGEVFYFTTGEPIEWGELQEVIGRVVFDRNEPLKTIAIPPKLAIFAGALMSFFGRIIRKPPFLSKTKMTEGAASGWSVSRKKAEELLNWTPSYTIESLVKESGEWYKAHGFL